VTDDITLVQGYADGPHAHSLAEAVTGPILVLIQVGVLVLALAQVMVMMLVLIFV